MDSWSVRPGFTFAGLEKKKMTMDLHDIKGQLHRIQIEGDKSLDDLAQQLRMEWGLEPWITITTMTK
jgi:hypothetical protein